MSISQMGPQQVRRRKKGCNEDCLYRIASRMCQLEASDQCRVASGLETQKPSKDSCADECCKPVAESEDCCKLTVAEKLACADKCCMPTTEDREICVDKCCKPAVVDKNTCADKCCQPGVDDKNDCADKCCEPAPTDQASCADECCEPAIAVKDSYADKCCQPAADDKDCYADECCKPATDNEVSENVHSSCVNASGKLAGENNSPLNTKKSCADSCCKPAVESADSCETEQANCTNSCCKTNSQEPPSALASTCSEHVKIAFARYESLIRQGQCLCKRWMQQMNFCCCSGGGISCTSHADDRESTPLLMSECKTDTFDNVTRRQEHPELAHVAAVESISRDAENSAAREHVVLNVAGMTCTGCSKKLTNVLNGIPGVHNPKVTFVSGTAAFELDHGAGTINVDGVLPTIEKQTGFKVSQVISGYQHLDVLVEPALAQGMEREAVDGFVSIEKIRGKQRYRVTYNPTIIGVRDLLPSTVELAPPAPDPSLTEGTRRLVKTTIYFVISTILTIPIVVLSWSRNPIPRQTREIASLVLATFVQAIAVPEFYVGAVKSLIFSRVIEMDMLVVISITAAYFYSVVAFALYEAGVEVKEAAFFETSSLLITLVLLGRLASAYARVRAVSAVSLRSLQAETTQIFHADGQTLELDARLLQFGDTIQVPPHTRIVTDGDVVSGTSAVDESMLTGESTPVPKQIGDSLIAGTMNGPGVLRVRLTRLPGANSITDIANLVENALGVKPRVQALADKVASWFIPGVVGIALVTFIVWIIVAFKVRDENSGGAIGTAITYGIAVLAISCPCALGLAVPMVLVISGGVAARAGVVIKEADAIERGYNTTDVVFDKTGTLTKGDLIVAQENCSPLVDITREEILALTRKLVSGNKHPVSLAISSYLKDHDRLDTPPMDITSIPGSGIEVKWNSYLVKAGNPYWTATSTDPTVDSIIEAGMTAFCITLNDSLIAAFGLTSTLRDEAASVVKALQSKNITCHIVSGDTETSVLNIASRLGINVENIASRSSPAQKMEYVKHLQSSGRIVLFCGDGTNDAVAVAQANVGVQIGSASDVTNGACDVTLLGGLEGLLTLLGISRRAFRRIAFNFGWTAVYNFFAVLLASGALVKVRIAPAYAGLGEIVSVGPVIGAAVSLMWGKNAI